MKNINCLVLVSKGSQLIAEQLKQLPQLNIKGAYNDPSQMREALVLQKDSVLFLDGDFPGLEGLEFLRQLPSRPLTIFMSHHQDYAFESFRYNVIDYLLKPISEEKLQRAVKKIGEWQLRSEALLETENNDALFVTSNYAQIKIKMNEITHVEGLKDYVKIFIEGHIHPILTRMTMKGIEEKLPNNRFFRVHRSYIVSLNKIEAIRNQRLSIGRYVIPVSDRHYENFRKLMAV
jgi:two-component system LytT family response regulator